VDDFIRPILERPIDRELLTRAINPGDIFKEDGKTIKDSAVLGRLFMSSKESGERIVQVTASIMDVLRGKMFEVQPESCNFAERMNEADLADLLRDCVEVKSKPLK
jgi:hypothetical protein